ncbi:MAG: IPT/TIG domain-containing protein, partial [Bryobacterales bacterium]|nr:IPT/TIG domain-containing protein [Bryobacterales bacterium]
MVRRIAWIGLMGAAGLWGQVTLGPVINPRGVINAWTQQPAPSAVAAGGLIWIDGINLGPATPLTGEGPVWPTELGGVQVMVGNRAAPLVSVSPARIVAQVPYETPAGQ